MVFIVDVMIVDDAVIFFCVRAMNGGCGGVQTWTNAKEGGTEVESIVVVIVENGSVIVGVGKCERIMHVRCRNLDILAGLRLA